MTTHKPATPLPWKSCSAFIDNAPNRAIVAHNSWGGKNVADCGAETNENHTAAMNAAYIAHACNAYPRLVAALRRALIESDKTMANGSHDVLDWQDANRVQGNRLRALLAELGE